MTNSIKFKALALFFVSLTSVIFCSASQAHPGGHGEEENYYPLWSIAPEHSKLNFTSTKNGSVTEKHHFERFTGSLLSNDQFVLTVDLTSLNTSIEIRDQRVNQHVFATEEYPKAMVIGKFEVFDIPMKGQTIEVKLQANLYFKNLRLPIEAMVTINNQGEQLVVTSTQPLILQADKLQIGEGIASLKKLANLKSINPEFPVSFKFTLER